MRVGRLPRESSSRQDSPPIDFLAEGFPIGRLPCKMTLRPRQQFLHPPHDPGRRNLQHGCNPHELADGRAVDAALDQADVGPVKSSLQREALLRDFLSLPDLP